MDSNETPIMRHSGDSAPEEHIAPVAASDISDTLFSALRLEALKLKLNVTRFPETIIIYWNPLAPGDLVPNVDVWNTWTLTKSNIFSKMGYRVEEGMNYIRISKANLF